MQGAHALAFRVEGNFSHPGVFLEQAAIIKSGLKAQGKQGPFRRVAPQQPFTALFFQRSVIAQQGDAGCSMEHGIGEGKMFVVRAMKVALGFVARTGDVHQALIHIQVCARSSRFW